MRKEIIVQILNKFKHPYTDTELELIKFIYDEILKNCGMKNPSLKEIHEHFSKEFGLEICQSPSSRDLREASRYLALKTN